MWCVCVVFYCVVVCVLFCFVLYMVCIVTNVVVTELSRCCCVVDVVQHLFCSGSGTCLNCLMLCVLDVLNNALIA